MSRLIEEFNLRLETLTGDPQQDLKALHKLCGELIKALEKVASTVVVNESNAERTARTLKSKIDEGPRLS